MVDEDSHSTDLCLGWTRSFNIFIGSLHFFFFLGQSYLATLVTPKNCTKYLEILILLYKLHILASDQKKFFVFFEQLLSNFRYKKQLLTVFWATFEQLFGKLRKTFWNIASNLWKALTTHETIS